METRSKAPSPAINSVRRKFLTDLAESAAEDYCSDLPKVEPAQILEENNVTISFNDYGTHFDGMLHHENGSFHVYCNEARCGAREDGRTRFTLAHELGHYLIPEHNAALRNGVAPSHPSFCNKAHAALYVETEANFFASRLLMPSARFDTVTKLAGTGLHGLCTVAQRMGTSLQSTAKRFEDSMIHPCAFVVWRPDKEPWFGVSAALKRYGYIFVKRRNALVEGSATALALATADENGEVRASNSVMSLWFSGVFDGSEYDLPLREEALWTKYGTITWLTVDPRSLASLPQRKIDIELTRKTSHRPDT